MIVKDCPDVEFIPDLKLSDYAHELTRTLGGSHSVSKIRDKKDVGAEGIDNGLL